MADWMSQMANAVDEAEAANALPQEEVPTEPAITPRSQVHDAPGSTRFVEELLGVSRWSLFLKLFGGH